MQKDFEISINYQLIFIISLVNFTYQKVFLNIKSVMDKIEFFTHIIPAQTINEIHDTNYIKLPIQSILSKSLRDQLRILNICLT